VLIALDGTEYFTSKKIQHDKVIPLEPEFIAPQDGRKNKTARTRRPSDGWRLTVSSTHGSIRFISATISSPASPRARLSAPSTGISSSFANHPLIR
jgi:hypothetical protein